MKENDLSIEDKAKLFDKMVELGQKPRLVERKRHTIRDPMPDSFDEGHVTKSTFTEYSVWEVTLRWWQPCDQLPDFKLALAELTKRSE